MKINSSIAFFFGFGLLVSGYHLVQAQSGETFKLAGIETNCTVPRLANRGGAGGTNIGISGGETLTDREAREVYACAIATMAQAYGSSGNPDAKAFIRWANFSTTPYTSATHGNRYVNNYANSIAAQNYGQYEKAGKFPVGSVLAKDGFVVNGRGNLVFNALTLMEKLPAGSSPASNDWKYTMILPDGMVVGTTGGLGAANVEFCVGCHAAVDAQDNVFFVPPRFRSGGWQRK